METLFIVASPLQCLNAFEAAKYFNTDKLDILLLIDGNLANQQQMESVINELEIKANISYITIPKNNNVVSRLFFLRNLKPKRPRNYDYVIVGHFRSIYQAVLANSYKGHQIFVDDGTRTINDIHFLDINGFASIEYRLKDMIYRLFSVKPFLISKTYTFFTYYASKVSPGSHVKIIKNNFDTLKKAATRKEIKKKEKVAFVGQSLVDSNLISLENYLELIEGIDRYYSDKYGEKKIVEYYVHRNESPEVENQIRERFGWQIKRNNLPLELHFIATREIPQEIGFFFTSAAETLSFIFEAELRFRSFYINQQILLGRKAEIESLYKVNEESPHILLVKDYYNLKR